MAVSGDDVILCHTIALTHTRLGVVMHAFDPSTQEAERGGQIFCELEANLV